MIQTLQQNHPKNSKTTLQTQMMEIHFSNSDKLTNDTKTSQYVIQDH